MRTHKILNLVLSGLNYTLPQAKCWCHCGSTRGRRRDSRGRSCCCGCDDDIPEIEVRTRRTDNESERNMWPHSPSGRGRIWRRTRGWRGMCPGRSHCEHTALESVYNIPQISTQIWPPYPTWCLKLTQGLKGRFMQNRWECTVRHWKPGGKFGCTSFNSQCAEKFSFSSYWHLCVHYSDVKVIQEDIIIWKINT